MSWFHVDYKEVEFFGGPKDGGSTLVVVTPEGKARLPLFQSYEMPNGRLAWYKFDAESFCYDFVGLEDED